MPAPLLRSSSSSRWRPPRFAQTPRSGKLDELKQLSIEELVDTDVTTASRRIERLADVAAAVTVISGEDLRRMGVQTLAQALRLAGHVHVSQVSGPQYAITARGFAISTANKMLVLIDGRTVYSPVFAGVFWETQDMSLLDIDRIEVTRGPGGSVWGANAVNGVINVITKRATETKGTLVNCPRARASSARIRCDMADASAARARIARTQRSASKTRINCSSGADAQDDFDFGQAGFRIESDSSRPHPADAPGRPVHRNDRAFEHSRGQPCRAATCWGAGPSRTRITSPASRRTSITPTGACPTSIAARSTRSTSTRSISGRTGATMSSSARAIAVTTATISATAPASSSSRGSAPPTALNVFAQDEFAIARGVFLTIGSKFERNEFTGFEIQPTVRAPLERARTSSVWGAVSRAVRVPTRFDTDLRIRIPERRHLLLTGSEDFESESGHRLRGRLSPAVSRARCRSTSRPTSIATTTCARRSSRPAGRSRWRT